MSPLSRHPQSPPRGDDARKPRSLASRLRLGLILLILPALAVCLPVVIVTRFFGQRPAPKAPPRTEGLQQSLQESANHLLPPPPTLGPDAITVTVRADHLAARLKKISEQAEQFGGSASEGLSTPTEKRLSVALPAGRAGAFRDAVTSNAALGSTPGALAGPSSAGKDFIDVVIRAAAEDE